MKKIEILVADSNLLIRKGLQNLLSEQEEFDIVGEVDCSDKLLDYVRKKKPEVIIIDIFESEFFKVDDLATIKAFSPKTNVVIITNNTFKDDVLNVLNKGVHGFILKQCSADEIIDAVYASSKNEKFFCGRVVDSILDNKLPQNCEPLVLSDREIEVIRLIAEGYTTQEIADNLSRSIHTINTHRKNILKKLGLKKPSELIMYAVKKGLVN